MRICRSRERWRRRAAASGASTPGPDAAGDGSARMNDECFYFGKSNFNLGCILGFACALITVIVPTVLCEPDDKHPNKQQAVGHLMPLGQQRLPEGSVHKVIGFPDAKRFFDDYVQQNEPVVFKGAANHIPAFKLWTDTYLKLVICYVRANAGIIIFLM